MEKIRDRSARLLKGWRVSCIEILPIVHIVEVKSLSGSFEGSLSFLP